MNHNLLTIKDFKGNYSYFNYEHIIGINPFDNIKLNKKSLISYGADHTLISNRIKKYTDYFKMFFLPEEPNLFCFGGNHPHILSIEREFNKIFTLCKYTKKWREEYFNPVAKREYTYIPFSMEYSHPLEYKNKDINVFYTGHNRGGKILSNIYKIIQNIKKSSIVDASLHVPISQLEKMKLNGRSKITISHSLLELDCRCINRVRQIENWNNNMAFSHIHDAIMPQFKVRTQEAAISKSIILHKKDPWNVIEDWYIPDEDFLYFDTEDDLKEKIHEILNNYDKYQFIAENAYNKAIKKYIELI